MRDFLFPIPAGGLELFKKDIIMLQEEQIKRVNAILALAGGGNFVISGCEVTEQTDHFTIAPGYLYIDGNILTFAGAVTADKNDIMVTEDNTPSRYESRTFKDGQSHDIIKDRVAVVTTVTDTTKNLTIGLLTDDIYFTSKAKFVPVGAMIEYPVETPPKGWLYCDGRAVSRTKYARLFNLLNSQSLPFGTGDGNTTFNLPDFRSRFALGFNSIPIVKLVSPIGKQGGESQVTLSVDQMPIHNHDVHIGTNDSGTNFVPASQLQGSDTSGTQRDFLAGVGNAGGGIAHNNMPPYLVVSKIIKF